MSKRNQSFTQNAVPAFEGRLTKLATAATETLGPSRLQRIRMFFGNLLKRIPAIARNTADDAARSKAGQNVLSWAGKKVKRLGALIAGGITAAVIFVQNTADDIKIRFRTKVKPVSLMKDIAGRVNTKIAQMNSADYAAMQRMQGPGVTDVMDKVQAGVSSSIGLDVNKSAKHLLWSKLQAMFTRQS